LIDETETRGHQLSAGRVSPPLSARPLAGQRSGMYRRAQNKRKDGGMATDRAAEREAAEQLAIAALGFIAADPELLPRFLAITGIEAKDIRRAAMTPGFLAGVLQFVSAHEPTLLRFAEETGNDPASVEQALRVLPFGEESFDRSI
jgi:hypothetical protein